MSLLIPFGSPKCLKLAFLTVSIDCLHKSVIIIHVLQRVGWSGGAMVLGKLPVLGRPTILITVGQGPTALTVGAGRGCLDIFTHIYPFFQLSPSLWETARYRLKYCLKGPLNPKLPTNNQLLQRDRQQAIPPIFLLPPKAYKTKHTL